MMKVLLSHKIKYLLLLIFAGCFAGAARGQNLQRGFFIKPNGDSITGQVKIYGNMFNKNVYDWLYAFVTFSEGGGKFYDYEPKHLAGYGFYMRDTDAVPVRYVSEKVYRKGRFLRVEVEGPLRFLKDVTLVKTGMHTTGETEYYIKKTVAELYHVGNFSFGRRRAKLKEYLSDCPVLEQELAADRVLLYKDMVDVILKYNDWYVNNRE